MSAPKVYNMVFQEERWGQKIHVEDIQVVQLAAYEALATRLAEVERELTGANATLKYCQRKWQETDRVTHSKMMDERNRATTAETALSSALAEIAELKTRLENAYAAKAQCNDDANYERKRANKALAENERLKAALNLAVNMVMSHEPPDSRAVSNEAVALASVVAGCDNPECWEIIRAALNGGTPND